MSGTFQLICFNCEKPIPIGVPHLTLGTRAAHMDCITGAAGRQTDRIAQLERELAEAESKLAGTKKALLEPKRTD